MIRLLMIALLSVGVVACSGPETGDSETATSAAGAGGTASVDADSLTTTTGAVPTGTTSAIGAPDETSTTSDIPSAPSTSEGASTETTVTENVTPSAEPSATQQVDMTGALLPSNRVLSFYGHPNSSAMGILGEYSKEEAHRLLAEQAAEYEAADPSHPVILAFELIATVAQPYPGDDGTYVAYTGDEIIQEYVDYVTANNMILILDLQIGHDTIPNQINMIRHWLELPNVHVALDPEFSMKANEIVPRDRIPGEFIGEADGLHIQEGMDLLSQIVAEAGVPPKMLIVHQFEEDMIFNKNQITPVPGVQFVLDMDGFGASEAKVTNYGHFVRDELIEFGGIKLFYKQDDPLLTPAEIVALDPPALVVIYQ
ncbi:MAG TPA: hypothetical protein VEX37_14030 [Thermomicrobiales bacterium]|nr:hypothetical protein [Thermomicrobiales bacterium]